MTDEDVPTIQCWACGGRGSEGAICGKCQNTGRLFFAYGRSFPYTQEGEKRAKSLCRAEDLRDR